MAMTFQAVIPEAYEEIQDWLSVIGGIGFAVAFLVSHLFPLEIGVHQMEKLNDRPDAFCSPTVVTKRFGAKGG